MNHAPACRISRPKRAPVCSRRCDAAGFCARFYQGPRSIARLRAAGITARADIAKARMQRITRVWWLRYRPRCDVFVSDRLLTEARAGRGTEARKRLAALESIAAIRLADRSVALMDSLLADGLFPESAHADAEHVAYAATNFVRFLLTWNCRHLANRMIFRRVIQRCESHGLRCPHICTPETMMRIYAHERHTY